MSTDNESITLSVVSPQQPISSPRTLSVDDKDLVVNSAIKQVFGNAYVMESEREEFAVAESQFRSGNLSVRDFIYELAISNTYRRRFFEPCGPYRFVELNFKHLLGRGPNSQEEISEHIQKYVNEGYESEILSYLNCEEYMDKFGEDTVPYQQFKGTYTKAEEFNRMNTLYSYPGTSDKSLSSRAKSMNVQNSNAVLSLDGAGRSSKMVSNVAMKNGKSGFVSVKRGIPVRPDDDVVEQKDVGIGGQKKVGQRVEIVPGSYMYLSKEEVEKYRSESNAMTQMEAKLKSSVTSKLNQLEVLKRELEVLGIRV